MNFSEIHPFSSFYSLPPASLQFHQASLREGGGPPQRWKEPALALLCAKFILTPSPYKPPSERGIIHNSLSSDKKSITLILRTSCTSTETYKDYTLSLDTLRIQQKVVNIHRQYAVFIIIRRNDILCNDNLFERIVNLTEGANFLRAFFLVGNRECGLDI